ncbi:hypothetical protein DFS34DRAFT_576327, partial [Phlyctochytrium arcticum]
YGTGLRSWVKFAEMYEQPTEPTKELVLQYMVHMGGNGYPVDTITKFLAGVRLWMVERGQRAIWEKITGNPEIKEMKDAIKKVHGWAGFNLRMRRKPSLTIADLKRVAELLNLAEYDDSLFLAILTTGFLGLCHLGELVRPDEPRFQRETKIPERSSLLFESMLFFIRAEIPKE